VNLIGSAYENGGGERKEYAEQRALGTKRNNKKRRKKSISREHKKTSAAHWGERKVGGGKKLGSQKHWLKKPLRGKNKKFAENPISAQKESNYREKKTMT